MKTIRSITSVLDDLRFDRSSPSVQELEKYLRDFAHDLRGPIATISMEAQSLKLSAEKIRAAMESSDAISADKALDSMDSIVENILDASHVLEICADKLTEAKQ